MSSHNEHCNGENFVDVDLHRYVCTGCNKISYYSQAAKEFFVNGRHSNGLKGLENAQDYLGALRQDVKFQLDTPEDLDWDYLLKTVAKGKLLSDSLHSNFTFGDIKSSINDIHIDAHEEISPIIRAFKDEKS